MQLALCWPSPDLVDDEDSVGVPANPALQVRAANSELPGQSLLGNIFQQCSMEVPIVRLGGFVVVENAPCPCPLQPWES